MQALLSVIQTVVPRQNILKSNKYVNINKSPLVSIYFSIAGLNYKYLTLKRCTSRDCYFACAAQPCQCVFLHGGKSSKMAFNIVPFYLIKIRFCLTLQFIN